MELGSSSSVLSKSQSGGALKLLDDLDELASLLGTDISKPRVWKSRAERQGITEESIAQVQRVELSKVTSQKLGESFQDAVDSGRLDTLTGNYRDAKNSTHKLAAALDRELINPDSAAFINPTTQEVTGLHEAIIHGHVQKTGHFMDIQSGKRLKLKECLERRIIVTRDVERVGERMEEKVEEKASAELEVVVPPLDLEEKQVVEVVDPSTQEWIPVSFAIARGIYDVVNDRYFNLKTGELLSSHEAARRNLVKLGYKLDSSMDSTDTDVLLEGHITGLKGLDINYSGEILSDDDDNNTEPDDSPFTSSPRKLVPERPVWPGDGAQAITGTNSPQSIAVLTSGSHTNSAKNISKSEEILTNYDSATETGSYAANDSTPNNEAESLGSNSSFVTTQSITVYDHAEHKAANQQSAENSDLLLSMIAPGERVQAANSSTTHQNLDSKMILDDSDSVILTANTSDVTLDISRTSSTDTHHREGDTSPPLLAVQLSKFVDSETEVVPQGSSTASYQSSVFDEGEKPFQENSMEYPRFGQSEYSAGSASKSEPITAGDDGSAPTFVSSMDSDTGPPPDPKILTSAVPATNNAESEMTFEEMPMKSPAFGSTDHRLNGSDINPPLRIQPDKNMGKVAGKITPDNVNLLTEHLMTKQSRGLASPPPVVSASLHLMQQNSSNGHLPSERQSVIAEVTMRTAEAKASVAEREKERYPAIVGGSREVSLSTSSPAATDKQTSGKIKVAPTLISSISKQLDLKRNEILQAESASPKSRLSSNSFKSAVRSPTSRPDPEPASPSLQQLSQQLAVEAVLQRNSLQPGRDKVGTTGVVKASERLASWKEKEKEAMAGNAPLSKVSHSPLPSQVATQRKHSSEVDKKGINSATSSSSTERSPGAPALNGDKNNNKSGQPQSADLLARVDAVMEKAYVGMGDSVSPVKLPSTGAAAAPPTADTRTSTTPPTTHIRTSAISSPTVHARNSGNSSNHVKSMSSDAHTSTSLTGTSAKSPTTHIGTSTKSTTSYAGASAKSSNPYASALTKSPVPNTGSSAKSPTSNAGTSAKSTSSYTGASATSSNSSAKSPAPDTTRSTRSPTKSPTSNAGTSAKSLTSYTGTSAKSSISSAKSPAPDTTRSTRSPTKSLTPGKLPDVHTPAVSRPTTLPVEKVATPEPGHSIVRQAVEKIEDRVPPSRQQGVATGPQADEGVNLHATMTKGSEERALSPSPLRSITSDPKSPSKVAFTYDPAIKKHKVTVYKHARTISYEVAVKLGVVNVKTGRFQDPLTGTTLSLREACLEGLLDDLLPALTDIQTGRVLTLKECVNQKLIDLDTGRLSESKFKSFQISVPNSYIPSLVGVPQPINILDAVKIGLLNPHTGQFTHALSNESCSLEEAVTRGYISGESTLVQDPSTHKHFYLSESLSMQLVNGDSGDIRDVESGHMFMTFYGALLCGVYKSVCDVKTFRVVHPGTGQPLNFNQAIRSSLIGHDGCLVYDTDQCKQVSFDEALAGGIVDRPSSSYVDKKTGASFSCEKAAELGLIQVIGSELCSSLSLNECVERLYPPPSTSVSALSVNELGTLRPPMKDKAAKQPKKLPVKEQAVIPVAKPKDESPRRKAIDLNQSVTVTERVVEIESKKRRSEQSGHSDNISATEYFTRGDVELEIPIEDESPIDSYEVKLSNAEPQAFDWESLPIAPLKERKITVESKERSAPLRDKEIIIIEREETGMTLGTALELGCLNRDTKEFTDPVSKETMSIQMAIEKGLIRATQSEVDDALEAYKRKGSVMEYKVVKEVEYYEDILRKGIPLLEAVKCNRLDTLSGQVKHPQSLVLSSLKDAIASRLIDGDSAWFTSPGSKRLYTISEAIADDAMDSHGFWSSPLSGQKQSFTEGVTEGHIRLLSPYDHTRCLLTQVKKFSVHQVIHPVSMERIDYNLAVLEGVVNTIEGIYKSPVTGDSLSIDTAISGGLISGVLLSSRTRRVPLPKEEPAPTHIGKRSYTITHAKDTTTGKNLTISEARNKGILDDDLTTFTDKRTGQTYSIQEAIDERYLVASLVDPAMPTFKETKPMSSTDHVMDTPDSTESKNSAPAKEDAAEQTGDYVNLDEENVPSSASSVSQKGPGQMRPVPTPVTDTLSFSISAITNPNNGELLTVVDALRHGFLDRGKKHFCNPLTRTVYTLDEAISNGWVHVKSNIDTHGPAQGQTSQPSALPGLQTFTILSVRNLNRNEDVIVAIAIAQGILDSNKQLYRNNVSGEIMSLDHAVKNGLIKLIPSVTGATIHQGLAPGLAYAPGSTYASVAPGSTYGGVALGSMYGGVAPGSSYGGVAPGSTYASVAPGSTYGGVAPGSTSAGTLQPNYQSTLYQQTMTSQSAVRAPSTPTLQSRRPHYTDGPTTPAAVPSPASFNNNKGEPVYTQIRKSRSRNPSGLSQPAPEAKVEPIDIYKANTRGLLSHQTGEVTVPQYGVSMLIDDAMIQGLITTKVPITLLLYRPFDPSSFAVFEAFQRGFINPVTLAVRHPATGQMLSLESALTTGLLHPRASTNSVPVSAPPGVRGGHTAPRQRDGRVRRAESMSRVENERRRVQRSAGTLHRGVKQPVQAQSQEYHNYGTIYHNKPHQATASPGLYQPVRSEKAFPLSTDLNGLDGGALTLTNNRSGAHLVNGKLYSAKSGHIINSNGQVVNLTDGEVMSLTQAERLGIVQRLADRDYQAGQSYVPASNMMFNRDPVAFPTKSEDNTGVMVVHVRNNHHSVEDSVTYDNGSTYSAVPSNMPVSGGSSLAGGGAVTLPPHLRQIDHHYAEIRQ